MTLIVCFTLKLQNVTFGKERDEYYYRVEIVYERGITSFISAST